MKRYQLWVLAALLGLGVAGCSGSRVGDGVAIDRFVLSPDRTTLDAHFFGGPPYDADDPCTMDYAAESRRRGDVLEVSVTITKGIGHGFPRGSFSCTSIGYGRTITMELDQPFTGSEIRDVNGTHRRVYKERDELATVTGLPSGWEIQVDSESPETRGGGWITVYGPYDDPAQQVVFVQAYNGSPHVWRAFTGVEHITVAGVDGRLFETPAGHQAIVWRPGTEGYALYAFEHVFTLEELLALAETVEPGT